MSFTTILIVLDGIALLAIGAVVVWRILPLRRNPEPRPPMNLTPFLPDEELEGRRLERALGWSLVFTLVIAVALPVYFLVEPTRKVAADEGFLERSIERGEILFANSQSEFFDNTRSLLCANCHGVDGEGGQAPFVLQPELDQCTDPENQGNPDVPECLPRRVAWQAPSLDNVLLRFDRGQVTEILVYGRPGTPMPAWGIESGKGVLNEQGIEDLVNYLESIQISAEEAKARSAKAARAFRRDAARRVDDQGETVEQATVDVQEAEAVLADAEASGDEERIDAAQRTLENAQGDLTDARAVLDALVAWNEQVEQMPEGEVLFRLNCARCHTKGWSYYDPARLDLPPLPPNATGRYGPNLTGGSTLRQFPGEQGRKQHHEWVAVGVPRDNQYGVGGISSGRMPHFARILTKGQIDAIVDYERSL